MTCSELLQGLDLACTTSNKRYYQQVVLINRNDVAEHVINSSYTENNISFNLKEGRSGFRFRAPEPGSSISATFAKSTDKGITTYDHSLDVPVVGITETIKGLLKQLANSDIFAAIQFTDGTVEIYGFENGLILENYTYEPQGSIGGAILPLSSRYAEYDPPYVYAGSSTDFDNLFAGIPGVLGGDFDADEFNNDFYIGT